MKRGEQPQRPPTYKVLSISLYHEDIQAMDDFVKQLIVRGYRRANRSALIRLALRDLERRGVASIAERELYRGMP